MNTLFLHVECDSRRKELRPPLNSLILAQTMWRLSGVYQAADSGCRYIQDPLSSWYTHLLRVSGLDVVRALTEEQDATVMTRAEFCADCIGLFGERSSRDTKMKRLMPCSW